MLAQPTKRGKLDSAIRLWASVNLVRVAWALQVQIEVPEGPKRRVAQEALVCHPIPRALRRPYCRGGWRFVPTRGPHEQSRGIRDVIIRVSADDHAIELFACHARGASACLEVECEGGRGDKGSVTTAAGTAQVGWLVGPGIKVLTEIALALKMTIAFPAVMVVGTFSVVSLTGIGACEVTVAIIARPVGTGTPFVFLQGIVILEPPLAAITICHVRWWLVGCKGVIARGEVEARSQNLYGNRMTHHMFWPIHVIQNQIK